MKFSRPEYWSGLLFSSPGDLPNPGIEPRSPALQVDSLPAELPGKPWYNNERPNAFKRNFYITYPARGTHTPYSTSGGHTRFESGAWSQVSGSQAQILIGVPA